MFQDIVSNFLDVYHTTLPNLRINDKVKINIGHTVGQFSKIQLQNQMRSNTMLVMLVSIIVIVNLKDIRVLLPNL